MKKVFLINLLIITLSLIKCSSLKETTSITKTPLIITNRNFVSPGETINLSFLDIQVDSLTTYKWKSTSGKFESNIGLKAIWTAPIGKSEKVCQITVEKHHNGKIENFHIKIQVVPILADFSKNSLSGFIGNNKSTHTYFQDGRLNVKNTNNHMNAAISSPMFQPYRNIPMGISTYIGLTQRFESINDYYYLSFHFTKSKGSKCLAYLRLQIYPDQKDVNYRIKTYSFDTKLPFVTESIVAGKSQGLKENVGDVNLVDFCISKDTTLYLTINGVLEYQGDALKEYIKTSGFEVDFRTYGTKIGLSPYENEIFIKSIGIY
ncbi:hypothetical protein [Saccharicrinis aurantiacus]|uniref:hypothetical protein n=1 Tax=Saccharicrinis aurantiacus TaxID=1849719 RepID=UPI00094F8B5E|nr:hypothetical protein [Saccharicrinis aurantiacus]